MMIWCSLGILALAIHIQATAQRCDLEFARPSSQHRDKFRVCLLWKDLDLEATCPVEPPPGWNELGWTTHGTVDRLQRIALQMQLWQGRLFASIFVRSQQERDQVFAFKRNFPHILLTMVWHHQEDITMPYPINLLRNIANWSAMEHKVPYVVLADADIVPNLSLAQLYGRFQTQFTLDTRLLVMPAFDLDDSNLLNSLSDKLHLKRELSKQQEPWSRVKIMHAPKPSYHFHLGKWLVADEPYDLDYSLMNEHYVIVQTRVVAEFHPFDENFRGRGFNKQSWHFELYASGFKYVMLPDAFVFNLPNPATTSTTLIQPETKQYWKLFRQDIVKRFGLQCRESMWRICDEKSLLCDRICTLPLDNVQAAMDSEELEHSMEMENEREKSASASWFAFERKLNHAENRKRSNRRMLTTREDCRQEGIDVVYTWVNGSEPAHVASRHQVIPPEEFAKPQAEVGEHHNLEFRFRDFGPVHSTLRYSLLSLAKYAKELRKIHIVVGDDQELPSFLNHSSMTFVFHRHSEILPNKCLPTFNSFAIETSLHKLKGLSKCYVYINDDMLLLQPLSFDNYYWPTSESLPYAVFDSNPCPAQRKNHKSEQDEWNEQLAYNGRVIQETMTAMMMANTSRNKFAYEPQPIFQVGHHGHFMVKEIAQYVYSLNEKPFQTTQCDRYRTKESAWFPLVYSNMYSFVYQPSVKRESFYYFKLSERGGSERIHQEFKLILNRQHHYRWLCINDLLGNEFPLEILEAMSTWLKQMFPEQSHGDWFVSN